jgi:membrane protease YdiL (CAAX protease family)
LSDKRVSFFDLARQAKRKTPWWLSIFLSIVFIFVGAFPGSVVVLVMEILTAPWENNNIWLSVFKEAITLIVVYVPIALLVMLWVRVFEQRSIKSLGLEFTGAVQKFITGFFVGFVMLAGAVALMALFGFVHVEHEPGGMYGVRALGGVLIILLGWLVQGPIEELVLRGWLFQVLGLRLNTASAIVISAIVFAFMHGMNPDLTLIALINIFLVGVFYALVVLWEKGLWTVCGMHAAWNWSQGNVFGLEVSGMGVDGGSLVNLNQVGPEYFTGGDFGPEGGIAVSLILGISILLIGYMLRKRTQLDLTGNNR